VGEDQKKNKPFGRLFFHSTIQASLIVTFQKKAPTKVEACFSFVGMTGFEPAASSSRTKRATGLRYIPR